LVLDPGKAGDTHVHANCEESIYVIRGEVQCRVGASPAELALGYSAAMRDFALAQ
jgi:uncharacterized cupin superfamily protein